MTAKLLMVVSTIYLYAGIQEGWTKDWNWLGFWACYAGANLFYIRAGGFGALH